MRSVAFGRLMALGFACLGAPGDGDGESEVVIAVRGLGGSSASSSEHDAVRVRIYKPVGSPPRVRVVVEEGFVLRALPFSLALLSADGGRALNTASARTLPAQALDDPVAMALLAVLALPTLARATVQRVFAGHVPPQTDLEAVGDKIPRRGDREPPCRPPALTAAQESSADASTRARLTLLGLAPAAAAPALLDYARVSVDREPLRLLLAMSRRGGDDEAAEDAYAGEGCGGVDDGESDASCEGGSIGGPSTALPVCSLVSDLVLLRSASRARGEEIARRVRAALDSPVIPAGGSQPWGGIIVDAGPPTAEEAAAAAAAKAEAVAEAAA